MQSQIRVPLFCFLDRPFPTGPVKENGLDDCESLQMALVKLKLGTDAEEKLVEIHLQAQRRGHPRPETIEAPVKSESCTHAYRHSNYIVAEYLREAAKFLSAQAT